MFGLCRCNTSPLNASLSANVSSINMYDLCVKGKRTHCLNPSLYPRGNHREVAAARLDTRAEFAVDSPACALELHVGS